MKNSKTDHDYMICPKCEKMGYFINVIPFGHEIHDCKFCHAQEYERPLTKNSRSYTPATSDMSERGNR